ncbi:MAG: hypothetical protein OJF47_003414 [Nitrospira sp.]|jgi:hypothetical protein|nr:MAG: hypothetical protein OJF47_003414 [Nitrospira sp.]
MKDFSWRLHHGFIFVCYEAGAPGSNPAKEVTSMLLMPFLHPALLVLTVMLLVTGFAVLKLTAEDFLG